MMDLLPTLLHAVDGSAPALPGVDGVSLLENLRDPSLPAPERTLHWTYEGQWAVRQGRYKLVADAREGMDPPATIPRALFDLASDPGEMRDLAQEVPEVASRLQEELEALRDAAGR